MRLTSRTAVLAVLAVALGSAARAQAPNVATYQGRLQENGLPISGTRAVEIRLCDALSGGACYPTPSATVPGGGCAGTVQCVTVVNGVFKAVFAIPSGVYLSSGTAWYLEVAVGQPEATSLLNTLTPREALTSFPNAVYASSATWLVGSIQPSQVAPGKLDTSVIATTFDAGRIVSSFLQDGAVETAKLADDAVATAKLLGGAVTSSKLQDSAVSTAKLATDSVTNAALLAGTIQTAKLAADAVATAAILGGAVNSAKLAFGAVDTNRLAPDAVNTNKLATDSVASAKLLGGAVQTSKLGADAVTNAAILNATIQTSKLANDAVATAAILNAAVDAAKLAPAAVSTSKLATDAVSNAAVLNSAVSTAKLAIDAVSTVRILNGAVTAGKFATGALLSGGVGLNKLGALTRMGAVKLGVSAQFIQLTGLDSRQHEEIVFLVPALSVDPLDIQIVFASNGTGFGNAYSVQRSSGGMISSDVGVAGVNLIGSAMASPSIPSGSQVHLRLTLDGNGATPAMVTGTYQATAFKPGGVVTLFQGSFGVATGGSPVTDVKFTQTAIVGAAFPAGTYLSVYGEDFP